jgi:hypothetical protein
MANEYNSGDAQAGSELLFEHVQGIAQRGGFMPNRLNLVLHAAREFSLPKDLALSAVQLMEEQRATDLRRMGYAVRGF